ncbi:hypothetical protein QO010_001566 [Caulobacter ginsengisoli]|uniref:DUF2145 domain-containing protein n=1 Tax=Caulobacter ginsengisoli TaxID=400775 RepID=A0ABU0IP60_9CAUL|nr:DUF2145 domain-containing protein [Caulobacter ginsengisoli]MDQ0463795.1 hypothetical protein [Caulobacter ginsengisoli]
MNRRSLLLALAALPAAEPALAQDSSAAGSAKHLTPPQAAAFGKALEKDLATRGGRVAMVFRSGRARRSMPEGLSYTHGAFWVYRDIKTDGGQLKGYAVYNLYQGDGKALPKDRSSLVQDWPTNFMQGSVEDDVAVILPTPEMQRRLLAVIDSPTYAAMHIPSYGLVANPFESRHQNCNTFVLDIVACAAWQTNDPDQVRVNLRKWFKPSVIKVDPLTRLIGPMLDGRLAVDDQDGPIVTAAYESIAPFMADNALSATSYSFQRPG